MSVAAPVRERKHLRVLLIALGIWSIPAVMVTVSGLAQGRSATVLQAFLAEGVAWYFWAFLAPAIFAVVRRWPFDGRTWRRAIAAHAAAALAFSLAYGFVATVLFLRFGSAVPESASLLGFVVWVPFGLIPYGATASVGAAVEYSRRLRERELHASRVETQLVESRLGTLRMQLQPHFLFNALNTVAMLVRQGDQQTSVRVLARLSDLLRLILDEARGAEVSLSEELEVVRRYLEIEEVRFGDRLRVEIDADERARSARVPSLLLQPLIENSIRHAIARKAAAGRIRLEARAGNGRLRLSLSDDGPGFPAGFEIGQSDGIGLRNTASRLRYLYGENATLETGASAEGGAEVRVTIPFTAPADGI